MVCRKIQNRSKGGKMIALWSIPFWLIAIAWCILTIVFVDDGEDGNDSNGIGATVTFCLTALLLYFLGDANIKAFYSFSFYGILKFIASYFIIGIIWSFIKWYLLLLRKKETIINCESIPSAKNYKKDIIVWMSYWPWSMVWTILNDPIKRFFNYVYLKFSTLYQKLADMMFEDIIVERKQKEREKREVEQKLRDEVEKRKQERKS